MPCICENCGCICGCGEKLCGQCFLEIECEDDEERNLLLGGRFYDESLLKEDNVAPAIADVT